MTTTRRRPAAPTRARAGQAATEFALVMALAGALCLPAVGFAQAAVAAIFRAQEAALTAPPLVTTEAIPVAAE